MDPPTYAPASTPPLTSASSSSNNPPEPCLLNLSPPSHDLSFVSGHLGVEPASVQGELQFKITSTAPGQSFVSLSISFRGTESASPLSDPVVLVDQSHLLWHHPHHAPDRPSSSAPSPDQATQPPGLLPFQFALPSDLPHCIHRPDGFGLSYELDAVLVYRTSADPEQTLREIHARVPVHILRYSRPAQPPESVPTDPSGTPFSLAPVLIHTTSPTPIHISLAQTLLRLSEPLALHIRIPPPAEELVREKGVQLRSVRAELRRHVRVRAPGAEASASVVLAMSGKSCRFSSTRAVFLRLTLYARPTGEHGGSGAPDTDVRPTGVGPTRCEATSQTTVLHEVSFSVLVTIHLTGRTGEPLDVLVDLPIGVVPDWPPSASKACEAAADVSEPSDHGPAPTYEETDDTGASSSTRGWDQELEEEYDGYESFSCLAGADGPAPPTIDEDESPPPAPDSPPEGIALQASPPGRVEPASVSHAHLAQDAQAVGLFVPEDTLLAGLDLGGRPPAYAAAQPDTPRSRSATGTVIREDIIVGEQQTVVGLPPSATSTDGGPGVLLNAPPPYAADFL